MAIGKCMDYEYIHSSSVKYNDVGPQNLLNASKYDSFILKYLSNL